MEIPTFPFHLPDMFFPAVRLFCTDRPGPSSTLPTSTRTGYLSHRRQDILHARHGAKDAALHLDHVQRRTMQPLLSRRTSVPDNHTLEAQIIRLPHRRRHANIRRNPTQHQLRQPAIIQQQLEIRIRKRAAARLINHGLALARR